MVQSTVTWQYVSKLLKHAWPLTQKLLILSVYPEEIIEDGNQYLRMRVSKHD